MNNASANEHVTNAGEDRFQELQDRIRGVSAANSMYATTEDRFQELISVRDCEIDDLSQQLFLSQQEVRKGQQRERELQAWKDQAILEVQGLKQQVQMREEQIVSMASTIESLQQRLPQFSPSCAVVSSFDANASCLVEPQPSIADSLSRSLPASPGHKNGGDSSHGSGGSSPDPASEQDAPEDALRSRQDAVFLMQEQLRRQIAMHRSSYAECGEQVLAPCSLTHCALPRGRAASPRPEPVSARQDPPRATEEFQALPEQSARTSPDGQSARIPSHGVADRGSGAIDELLLRPLPRGVTGDALPSGRAASPRPEPVLARQDPPSPEAVVRAISAQPKPVHQEQSPFISVPDDRPLRPMPSGGMLVSLAPSDPLPSPKTGRRERSSSRSAPADRSSATTDERPLRPMPSGGSLVSLATSFFDESPEDLAQKKTKQQKMARQIEQRRQRQTAAVTASSAGAKAARGAKPTEELIPAETTRKADSMLSHAKSVPTVLLAGRAPVAARATHGSPAQTARVVHTLSRQVPHQVPPQAPLRVPEVPNVEPISARELASPCERQPLDLHQKFASRRDEMKRQRGPIAVGSSVPTRNASAALVTPTTSEALVDFAHQRSAIHLHDIRAA